MHSLRTVRGRLVLLTGRLIAALVGYRARVRSGVLMLSQIDAATIRRQLVQAAVRDGTAQLEAACQDLADVSQKPTGAVRAATVASG